MSDIEESVFSDEYNTSEDTGILSEANEFKNELIDNNLNVELEQTAVEESNDYNISKPKRIIIKAIIKND